MQSKSAATNPSPKVAISLSTANKPNGLTRTYENRVVSSNVENLYLDAETADAIFVFGSNGTDGKIERVPAHKNLLSIASDVFRAMFYGEWKVTGDIQMNPDKGCPQTASAFREFLQYFYWNRVTLTAGNVAEVMGLGHRYNVVNCFNACVEFISDSLTIENVCIGYALAILYEHIDLKIRCERIITLNTSAVFNSANFLASGRDVLAHILHLNLLSCSETDVFMACMAWIQARTNDLELSKEIVRAKLEDLFYEIRFTSMTMKEFCLLNIRHSHLFTFEEYKYIVQKIALPKSSPSFTSGMFNNSPREAQWIDGNVLSCYRPIDDDGSFAIGHKSVEDIETTIFSTNKAVLLGKFVCACVRIRESDDKTRELNSNLPVHVKIIENPNIFEPRSIAKIKQLAAFTSALQPMKQTAITLPKPALIRPGHTYEIHMQQTPDAHCFEHRHLKTKVLIGCNITIRFHDDLQHRNKPVGLIQELLFNRF